MSNKRYYWLKLKENFFNDKTIKKLRKIAGGDTYTIIYLKLLLKATETDGKLYFDGVEDTFAEEIALDIDEEIENVKVTLMYLIKCGLLIEISEYELELTRINEMIGSETNKAELMRKKRARDKQSDSEEVTKLPETVTILPSVTKTLPYIDIDIDIDIEKDKNIEKEKKKNTKHKYGEYKHVLLTDSEYNKLLKDYGSSNLSIIITYLDEYLEMKGTKYKSHYMVIKKWGAEAALKKRSAEVTSIFKSILEA